MNLHRAGKVPDWLAVEPRDRNIFQKLALKTHGLVTPANGITVIGLVLVAIGLAKLFEGEFLEGLVLLSIGRLLDVADGAVAEITKTKSPLGEMFDAVADKVGIVLTIIVLLYINVIPLLVLGLMFSPQIVIASLVIIRRIKTPQRESIHPTLQGKLSMAGLWVGILGFLALKVVGYSIIILIITYSAAMASIILGFYAYRQYLSQRD